MSYIIPIENQAEEVLPYAEGWGIDSSIKLKYEPRGIGRELDVGMTLGNAQSSGQSLKGRVMPREDYQLTPIEYIVIIARDVGRGAVGGPSARHPKG
jgi:hypothetical protein